MTNAVAALLKIMLVLLSVVAASVVACALARLLIAFYFLSAIRVENQGYSSVACMPPRTGFAVVEVKTANGVRGGNLHATRVTLIF